MIKLKCKSTGKVLEFAERRDANWYSGHEDYEEIHNEANEKAAEAVQVESQAASMLKKRGRPFKVVPVMDAVEL